MLFDAEGNAYLGGLPDRRRHRRRIAARRRPASSRRLASGLLGERVPAPLAELVERAEPAPSRRAPTAFAEARPRRPRPDERGRPPRPETSATRTRACGRSREADARDFFGRPSSLVAAARSTGCEDRPGSRGSSPWSDRAEAGSPRWSARGWSPRSGEARSGDARRSLRDRDVPRRAPDRRARGGAAADRRASGLRGARPARGGLARAARGGGSRRCPATPKSSLVVDQFEEVFTLTADERERSCFLESLRVAAVDPESRLRVVVTLRADFYDRPLVYPRFGELLAARTEAVPPLTPDELEQAIRAPGRAGRRRGRARARGRDDRRRRPSARRAAAAAVRAHRAVRAAGRRRADARGLPRDRRDRGRAVRAGRPHRTRRPTPKGDGRSGRCSCGWSRSARAARTRGDGSRGASSTLSTSSRRRRRRARPFGRHRLSPSTASHRPASRRSRSRTRRCSTRGTGCAAGSTTRATTSARTGA